MNYVVRQQQTWAADEPRQRLAYSLVNDLPERVPVVGLVPVVNVTVPSTPLQVWLAAHAIVGLVPAAAPAASVIVPVPA